MEEEINETSGVKVEYTLAKEATNKLHQLEANLNDIEVILKFNCV